MEYVAKLAYKNKFGKDLFFPMNDIAVIMCKIKERMTLGVEDLVLLRTLKFKLEIVKYNKAEYEKWKAESAQ